MQSSGNRSTNKMGFEEEKNLKSGIKVTYVQCQPKFNSSFKVILKGKVWLQINKVNGFYTINGCRLYADINLNNLDSIQSAKLSGIHCLCIRSKLANRGVHLQ